ncbi:hypothetical protein SeMB42_g07632 [Synchytrium endobioticum]|uniref:RNA helicase n=1 Tax=Synchytrium endobioticum TaxID=286115 RepID=A0A507BYW9_9FUNG|nr:hypothetical protein SeMB42_g07632 [Synchytrium endobioticum]TPX37341.1 hypothetical protein SeLEV6574_g07916 [Synchytrium endobioticum]
MSQVEGESGTYRDGDEHSQSMHQAGDAAHAAHQHPSDAAAHDEHQWMAAAPTWQEGVTDERLEKELYETPSITPNFDEYLTISVRVKGDDRPEKIDEFTGIKMHELLVENIKRCKYDKPTPIQKYAIPIIHARRDLIACAQTGSGKTAAFLIPIINRMLLKGPKKMGAGLLETPGLRYPTAGPIVLIIVPTRELAIQIFNEARKFSYKSWIKPKVIYGGASSMTLKQELREGCDILVATTGKLKDFLGQDVVRLTKVKFLVIDEADRMLELGFQEDLEEIVQKSGMPQDDLSTAMFSATWPKEIRHLTGRFLIDPLAVTVGSVARVPSDIVQQIKWVDDTEKRPELLNLFSDEMEGLSLIFVGTKMAADSLDDFLFKEGLPVTSIHSGRTMMEREDAIAAFRHNKCPIMIATDIAARGLDIPNVTMVVNFDMPKTIDDYIHRIGRTARVGNAGTAISFYNDSNSFLGPDLVKLLKSVKQPIPEFLQQYDEGDMSEETTLQDDLSPEDLKAIPVVAQGGDSSWNNGGDDSGGGDWGGNNNGAIDSSAWNSGGDAGADSGWGAVPAKADPDEGGESAWG